MPGRPGIRTAGRPPRQVRLRSFALPPPDPRRRARPRQGVLPEGLETLLRAILAGIPYQWHTRNDIAAYEGYYASVLYSLFAMAGLDVAAEDSGSRGRADMAVRGAGGIYLFEFKVAERNSPGDAMAQLRERGYADKYRHLDVPIHLIAVEFSRETRNLVAFETLRA